MGRNDDKAEQELLKLQLKRRRDLQQATTKRRRLGQEAPKPFGDLLNVFFRKDPEILKQIEETRALEAWPNYVGEAAARVSKAARIRNGTLTVVIRDPLWMQQLSFLKQGIIRRYQADFPKLGIREIFFSRT
jgi:hypothetical protein